MFGYCVWYALYHDHPVNLLVRHLAVQFGTGMFYAHIAMEKKIPLQEARVAFGHHQQIPIPWFKMTGDICQTTVGRFYALEQHCDMYNVKRLGSFHVSLAYRLDQPFTKEEINTVRLLVPTDMIHSADLYLALMDCTSRSPKYWKYLERSC